MNKNYLTLLLSASILLLSSFPLSAGPAIPDFSNMPKGPGGGMMPMPSKEEMEEIEKFLSTLSEDELNELAQIGEEIIKTAETEGQSLFGPPSTTPKPPQKQPTPSKTVDKTVAKKVDKKEKPLVISTNDKKALKKLLEGLIKAIDSIRQKATIDEEMNDTLSPFDSDLNSLLYYLHVIDSSHFLNYLMDKESEDLRVTLKMLAKSLIKLNNRFIVPEYPLKANKEQKNKYKDKLKTAHSKLKEIISELKNAFNAKKLLIDLEKIIKKHEPEALKVQKEQESQVKKAEDFIRRTPTTNIGGPGSYGGSYGSGYSSPFGGGSNTAAKPTTATPAKSTTSHSQVKRPDSVAPKNPTPKRPTPKKPVVKPAPPKPDTIESLEQEIPRELNKVERYLSENLTELFDFADNYGKSQDETKITDTLQELNHHLKMAKNKVTSWYKKIDTEKDFRKKKKSKDAVKKSFDDSSNFQQLKDLHKKLSGNKALKSEAKRFDATMKDISNKIKA